MSISFSGLASGMDTSSWVEALVAARKSSTITPLQTQSKTLNAQKTTLSKVKSTYSSLLTNTQKFTDSKFGVAKDIFAANTVSSSSEKTVSASVTNSSPRQTISIEVLKLATSTKVTSQTPIAANIDENTQVSALSSGSVKEGTMSFYVGEKRYQIDVSLDDTLGDIADKMKEQTEDENGVPLIDVTFESGKFTVRSTNGANVSVGTNSDSSTLMSALALEAKEDGTTQSTYAISGIDLTKPLLSTESGFFKYDENGEKIPTITEGTFTIGNAEFTITDKTTMNELISRINSSANANATAFYDSVQNKMIITSKQEGAFNVNIEAGTSNITDIFGLTRNGGIISETQELGQNSEIILNGSKIQSYSNTLTSEVTGIAGLTLSIKDVTAEGKPVNIVIGQDTESIVKSVEDLVNALNTLISTSDAATQAGADMQYDSSLNSLRTRLRTSAVDSIDGSDVYKTLASIGITTGEIGASVEADTNKFVIDKEKLKKALNTDPQAVKNLLIGNETAGTTGVVNKIQDIVQSALDLEKGFFVTRETTISSQISSLNSKIDNRTTQLENYQTQLEKKFQAMETQISNLQKQYSQMSSILS